MEKENLIHHQVVQCPECGKEILIAWSKVQAITLKEYQKRNQELLKRAHAENRPKNMEKNKQAVEKALEPNIEQKIETEKVTFELPKAVMDLLRAYRENIQEYLEYTILGGFISDIESCDGPFGNYNDIVQKFNLEPTFKAYGLSYTPLAH